MIVTINYEFELNGKKFEAIGDDIADTENSDDILFWNIEEVKEIAICNALDLTVDELTTEIDNSKFSILSIECNGREKDFI